jgi:phosphoribosylamine--glycine ligase
MKFIFHTQFGEIVDLAAYLTHVEGHDVLVYIDDHNYRQIGEGIVEHTTEWWRCIGQDRVWVFDGCGHGDLQDWLREIGESVVGGTKDSDALENDRQLGQKWFEAAGFDQVFSKNFKDIDSALEFVREHSDTLHILKQNGDAPKSLSHKGQFDSNEDMIFHLEELKKHWNEAEFGHFDCDIMEVVTGTEVAASAFFNGEDWLKNSKGKVVGFLNFEEKKEGDGGTGETCGEMGTTFVGVDEDNDLFANILLRPEIAGRLREIGFRGVFDINCILADDERLVALEPTCRPGIPATSYEMIEGMESPVGELLSAMAKGINRKIEIHEGLGMVMCVVAKPFPLEADVEDDATSMGERLWLLDDGQPSEDFSPEQRKHIHLYNFKLKTNEETGETYYSVPTKSGYLFTVTRRGEYISTTRDALIHYIKKNVFLPGMKYRSDIGARVEEFEYEQELAGSVS